MKKLIEFLETDETMLRAAMLGMLIYAVHNSIIIFTIEHMPFFVKLPFSIIAAVITEFIALVLFVKGKKWFGRVYATCLFGLGNFYYWYFMEDPKEYSLVAVSWVFNTIHYAAALYLSEIFYDRRLEKKIPQNYIIDLDQAQGLVNEGWKPEQKVYKPHKKAPQPSATMPLEPQDTTEEKKFVCPECSEAFARKFTLQRHLKTIHAQETRSEIDTVEENIYG